MTIPTVAFKLITPFFLVYKIRKPRQEKNIKEKVNMALQTEKQREKVKVSLTATKFEKKIAQLQHL